MAQSRTEIQNRYDSVNRTPFSFKLHNENDADIIKKLRSVKSINGYIKELIRADINKENEGNKIHNSIINE